MLAGLVARELEAAGDRELGKTWTRVNVAALELIGRQHLGYSHIGVDEQTRKFLEKAERERARGRRLRAA